MDAVLQPATPVPTTVKSRARARLVELHELHGWNKDSPISISKPKSDSKERQREAGAKRMRNMGFYEVAAECGYSTAAALREELEHRVFTEGQDKRDYKKLIEKQKQEQARRDKQFWDMVAKVKELQKEREELTLRIAERNRATTQRLAKEEAEMEVKMRAKMEAKLEAEREELRRKYRIDHEMAMIKIREEWTESVVRRETFQKLVRECVDREASHLKAQIATLEKQAKPQPKPKPQPGTAALHKRVAELEEENQALTAQLTKIESLKRAAKMQRDRRGVLRKMENAQENTESPAAKKRNTKGSTSSTTVNNNS